MSASKRLVPIAITTLFVATSSSAFAGQTSQSPLDPYYYVQPKGAKAAVDAPEDGAKTYITIPAPDGKESGPSSGKSHMPKVSMPHVPHLSLPKLGSKNKTINNDVASSEPKQTTEKTASSKGSSKGIGSGIADKGKGLTDGIANGAKASGDYLKKGASAIGEGFKTAGEKMKDGTQAVGNKLATVTHLKHEEINSQSAKKLAAQGNYPNIKKTFGQPPADGQPVIGEGSAMTTNKQAKEKTGQMATPNKVANNGLMGKLKFWDHGGSTGKPKVVAKPKKGKDGTGVL
jgi:hypothetical protein